MELHNYRKACSRFKIFTLDYNIVLRLIIAKNCSNLVIVTFVTSPFCNVIVNNVIFKGGIKLILLIKLLLITTLWFILNIILTFTSTH